MADKSSRKDEIISLQNAIMSDMLRQNLRALGNDLWGAPRRVTPEKAVDGAPNPTPDEKAAGNAQKALPRALKEQAEAPEAEEEAPPEDIEALKEELLGYIGLSSVKKEVDSLINWISICKKRQEVGLPTPELSLHMVYSGNPGTGKTMIARLMARIFRSLGVLSKGQLVEVDRSGLVAGFVGQTAIKTQEAVEKAKGGVLFIDEAYSLNNPMSPGDFGQEAINTVLKAMEDNRDDLVVIVAGYTDLMEAFVRSNPGLESRFNRFLFFPDYTVDEMIEIFDMRCGKGGYKLSEDARDELRDLLTRAGEDIAAFGNARGVRNLFERAIANQADRLAASTEELTRDRLMTITAEDLIIREEKP